MTKERGLGLIGILIVIGTLLLTVGGLLVWQKKNPSTPATELKPTVGEPVTPGLSEDVKDLPTAAPVTTTPFSGKSDEIQVISSKSLYHKGEEVEIQVTNYSSQTISYEVGPGCGVSFERKVDSKWQPQHLCLTCFWASSKIACFPETIAPNAWIKISRPIESQTPSGTYRAVFNYFNSTVYSSEFTIL